MPLRSPAAPAVRTPSRSEMGRILVLDLVASLSERHSIEFTHSHERSFHLTAESNISLENFRREKRSLLPRRHLRS